MHGTTLVQTGKGASTLDQSVLSIIEEWPKSRQNDRDDSTPKLQKLCDIVTVMSKKVDEIHRSSNSKEVLETKQDGKDDATH